MGKRKGSNPDGDRVGFGEKAAVWVKPERYFEKFFRDTAHRLDYIRLLSDRHFEARRFYIDLRRAFRSQAPGPGERA